MKIQKSVYLLIFTVLVLSACGEKENVVETEFPAEKWFSKGERIPYDPQAKKFLQPKEAKNHKQPLHVFQRIVKNDTVDNEEVWTTFLPGFPDGSFGWTRIDQLLGKEDQLPRLFVEYLGQGDSDKPIDYSYNTIERADLVEAMWKAHSITSTFVVSFDYSSLVVMELLSRHLERIKKGERPFTQIKKILIINGGLFADGHSHPWYTTPLLKTPMGKMGTWVAQRSKFAFNQMMKGLWSKKYNVTSNELAELYNAISRRNGLAFVSNAAGFVDEHQDNAERWDFQELFQAFRDSTSFHLVGSIGDPFEPNQIVKARERLGKYNPDIRLLPGGHLTTSEHPEALTQIIREIGAIQLIRQQ